MPNHIETFGGSMFEIVDGLHFYPNEQEVTDTPAVVVIEMTGTLKRADTGKEYPALFLCYGSGDAEESADVKFEIVEGVKFQGRQFKIKDGANHLFIQGFGALIREGKTLPYEAMFACYGPLSRLKVEVCGAEDCCQR